MTHTQSQQPSTESVVTFKRPQAGGSVLIPVIMVLCSIVSITASSALAKQLFTQLTPPSVTALRLFFSSLILLVVMRPWRHPLPRNAWGTVALYGGSIGLMNLCFYLAIERLPLGIAVGLEFTGPLLLALISSRTRMDIVWAVLAICGISLLIFAKGEGDVNSLTSLDPLGLLYISMASALWALYIIFGKKAGQLAGPVTVVYAMCMATCVALPVGLIQTGTALFALPLLPTAIALGLFSSALPYALEIRALEKLPTYTFGILMSLEPALAAFCGFLFLREQLNGQQWVALGCITLASIGSTLSSRKTQTPAKPAPANS